MAKMEKFEKWYLPDKDIYINEYEMQKRAWKAALMWILIAEWNTPDELTELIGRELSNE